MMRRLRGIVTTAIAWSLLFVLVQLPIATLLYFLVPREHRAELWPILVGVTAIWAATGLFSGAVFAAIIVQRARERTLAHLSMRRFALWGTAAGGLTPVLVAPLLATLGVMPGKVVMGLALSGVGAILGCGMASSTLWVARRAEARADLAPVEHQRELS